MTKRSDTGPFSIVPRWLLESKNEDGELPKSAEIHLYAVLGMHADQDEGKAWPSHTTLANEMGCSVSTVKRSVRSLVERGALRVEIRFSDYGDPTTNFYYVIRSEPRGDGSLVNGGGVTGERRGRVTSDLQNKNHKELDPTKRLEDEKPRLCAASQTISTGRKETLLSQWRNFLDHLSSCSDEGILSPIQDPAAYARTAAGSGGRPPEDLDTETLFLVAQAVKEGMGLKTVRLPALEHANDTATWFRKVRLHLGDDEKFHEWLVWSSAQAGRPGSMKDDCYLLYGLTQAGLLKSVFDWEQAIVSSS